jgi:translation initiation factor IF-2
MGHVDHGKTSLLDAIKKSNVTASEAGGITQHIGAYTVTLASGAQVTFIDTPGHEAFTAMRARGASVTDIVVLVVAADDGVMPQTIESIRHAQAAEVPLVVAVNKIDKPSADIERIKRQLAEQNILAEDWGGEVLFVPLSAKTGKGVPELLETLALQAEILELKANPNARARGVVLEANLDKSRGPVATVLIQDGTLRRGDVILAGSYCGRVKALVDSSGQSVKEATPALAVEILGLDGVPMASDEFYVVSDEAKAREIVAHRSETKRREEQTARQALTLESFFEQAQTAVVKELPLLLKADTQGSLEAIRDALNKLSTDAVKVKIMHTAVGGINESDVLLASASKAIIIGFNIRPETKAIATAKAENVDLKMYRIIYEMVDDIKKAMSGLLSPTRQEIYLGRAQVRDTFSISKVGVIAGCYVVDGKINRKANLRLLRDSVVLFEGKVGSLKRFKEDVSEVATGFECGMAIEGYQDIKSGDLIEAFEVKLTAAEL